MGSGADGDADSDGAERIRIQRGEHHADVAGACFSFCCARRESVGTDVAGDTGCVVRIHDAGGDGAEYNRVFIRAYFGRTNDANRTRSESHQHCYVTITYDAGFLRIDG